MSVQGELEIKSAEQTKRNKAELSKKENRISELDILIQKLYEANVLGKLSDERFIILSRSYKEEQASLKEEIISLKANLQLQEEQNRSVEQFIGKVKNYSDLRKLTPYALHDLVKAIYIYEEPAEYRKHREKSLRIQYDICEDIDIDKLMKA